MLCAKTKENISTLLLTVWLLRYPKKQTAGIIVLKVDEIIKTKGILEGKSKKSLNQKVTAKTTGDHGSISLYNALDFNTYLGGEREV